MEPSTNFGEHSSNNRFKERERYRRKEKEHKNQKGEGEEFDLLSTANENKIFKIVFDYYTPRPHFVILPRDGLELEGHDYSELQETTKLELVKAATAMISEYKLEGGSIILSIHRGAWLSNKSKFHAPICADVNQYMQVFHNKESEIPNWPNKRYVTRQWRASSDPTEYEMNVMGYPFKTYFKQELKSITELKKRDTGKASFIQPTTYEGYTLLYHHSEPRVGFAVEKKSEDTSIAGYVQTLNVMNRFAGEHGLTNMEGSGDDKGCHICLVLSGTRHG